MFINTLKPSGNSKMIFYLGIGEFFFFFCKRNFFDGSRLSLKDVLEPHGYFLAVANG